MDSILVLIGLPASGKTFLAGKLCSDLQSKQFKVNIFCFDDLCPLARQVEIANRSSNDCFKTFRSIMKAQVESFFASPNPHNKRRIAIVDDNNYYKSMRHEYYQVAAKYVIGFLQIFVRCESSLAVHLNRLRPVHLQVAAEVITRMETKLEVPSEPWENTLIVCQGELNDSNLMRSVRQRIEEACSNPVRAYEKLAVKQAEATKSRMFNDRSLVHKLDNTLRRLISRKIQNRAKEVDPRVLAKHLNTKRQSLMESIKSGHIAQPEEQTDDDSELEKWIEKLFDKLSNE